MVTFQQAEGLNRSLQSRLQQLLLFPFLTSFNRRSENVRVSPASVVELELGDRHKG